MTRSTILLALASVVSAIPQAHSQAPLDAITAAKVQADIDFLASDQLLGRDSGHPGAEIAALYIESVFRRCGMRPLHDRWQHPVAIPGAGGVGVGRVSFGGTERAGVAVLEALRSSPGARAKARAVVGLDNVTADQIAILPGGDEEDDAATAARGAFERGAIAVVFVSARETFRVSARRDPRRMGGESSTGGGYLAHGAVTEIASDGMLARPALRVSRDLGTELIEAAERGEEIAVEVSRAGRDQTTNVIGWIEGSDPLLRQEYVILGAHYDHVGHDDAGNIWNGADDNGSGTSAVLQVADVLSRMATPPRRSIVLACWGAEERGLFGSRAFVKDALIAPEQIVAYLNLDMISRNDADHISALNTSQTLYKLAEEAARRQDMTVDEGVSFFLQSSDTEPFMKQSIPTLFFFSGLHGDYHRPSDDPGTIDAGKVARVARATLDVLLAVADRPERPTYDAPTNAGTPGRGPSRRLGIYPSASGDVPGVRVESVTPRSVADNAGLQAGDLIVRIAGAGVEKVADLRTALQAPKADEKFPIEVLRGTGDSITLWAVFDK